MEVFIGDKIWAKYGPGYVVGTLVETSPNQEMVAVSGLDLDSYNKMKQAGQFPCGWYITKHLELLDYLKGGGLPAKPETALGFTTK